MNRLLYFVVLVSGNALADELPRYIGTFVPEKLRIAPLVRSSQNEVGAMEQHATITFTKNNKAVSLEVLALSASAEDSVSMTDPNSPAMRAHWEAARDRIMPSVGGVKIKPRGGIPIRAVALQYGATQAGQYEI